MILNNKSTTDTRALRRLFCEVHRRMAVHEGRLPQWDDLSVVIVNRRGNWHYSGWAVLRGRRMMLRIASDAPKPHKIAALIEHELFHSYGYNHKQMAGYRLGYVKRHANDAETFAWADAMFPTGMPTKRKPAKPKPDIQIVRYERVMASLKRWATKLKRAQTALKTLNAKRRYYEAALTAAGKLPGKD